MKTYPDSVRYLYALGNELKTAKLGLDRVERLLRELGNPQHGPRIIHVAGTNGTTGSGGGVETSGATGAGTGTGAGEVTTGGSMAAVAGAGGTDGAGSGPTEV